MPLKRCLYAARTILLLASVAALSYPRTLVVGKPGSACPGASYTTISGALSDAFPYDTVAVCSGFYPEQLVITKPVTVRSRPVETAYGPSNRVLIQPASLSDLANIQSVAAVTVVNTTDVTIENIAIDASDNGLSGCT